jgi:hypothetical protein
VSRAVTQFLLHQPESIKGFQTVIDLDDGRKHDSTTAVILGHLAARRHGDAAAAVRFLAAWPVEREESWPYPVVRFFRGDIAEATLLEAAGGGDGAAEARCSLGFDHLLKGRTGEAVAHFRWVKEHGSDDDLYHHVALMELDRLEKSKK